MSDSIPALIAAYQGIRDWQERVAPSASADEMEELKPHLNALERALESLSAPSGDDREPLMSDLIPDEEQLAEANKRYPTDHEVDDPHGETGVARSDPYGYDATANEAFLEGAMWERARRVSPVTRESLEPLAMMIAGFYHNATDPFDAAGEILESLAVSPPAEVTDAMVERGARKISKCLEFRPDLCDGCARRLAESRAVLEAALGVLPAEVEWEYGEFSKDDIQEDGSIHPWAEPLDTWETPPTGDDLSDLADVGSVCARRVKACPWVPVKGTEQK